MYRCCIVLLALLAIGVLGGTCGILNTPQSFFSKVLRKLYFPTCRRDMVRNLASFPSFSKKVFRRIVSGRTLGDDFYSFGYGEGGGGGCFESDILFPDAQREKVDPSRPLLYYSEERGGGRKPVPCLRPRRPSALPPHTLIHVTPRIPADQCRVGVHPKQRFAVTISGIYIIPAL